MSGGMSKIRKNKKGWTENGHMGKNQRRSELKKRLGEELK